jgi:hypothetical protein
MYHLNYLIATIAWMLGIATAAGWWKLAAVVFPPFAWYELAVKVLSLQSS